MQRNYFNKVLLGSIVTVMVGVILVVGFAIFLTNTNKPSAATTTQATRPVQAEIGVSVEAPTTPLPPSPTPTIVPTPTATEPGVSVISPTVAVGEKIPLPLEGNGTGIVLRRSSDVPIMSLQEARQAVYNRNISWALGGNFDGKPVTLTAAYGLATIGSPTANGKGWLGPQNIPLQNCTSDGKCNATGVILDHIENRPMWVLDYSNISIPANGPACLSQPCPTPQIYNHSVYTVDAQTRMVITADLYTAP